MSVCGCGCKCVDAKVSVCLSGSGSMCVEIGLAATCENSCVCVYVCARALFFVGMCVGIL